MLVRFMDEQKLFGALCARPFGGSPRIGVAHSRPPVSTAAIMPKELIVGKYRVVFQTIARASEPVDFLDQQLLKYAIDEAGHQHAVSSLVFIEHESERVHRLFAACVGQVLQRSDQAAGLMRAASPSPGSEALTALG